MLLPWVVAVKPLQVQQVMSPGRRRRNCAAHCVLRSARSQLAWIYNRCALRAICVMAVARLSAACHAHLVDGFWRARRCLPIHRGGTSARIVDFWL